MKFESKKSIISISIAFVLAAVMLFSLAGVWNHLSASAEEADNYKTNVSISTDKTFVRPGDTFELTVSFSTNRPDSYYWDAISCVVSAFKVVDGTIVEDRDVLPYIEPVKVGNGIDDLDGYYAPDPIDYLGHEYNPGILFSRTYTGEKLKATDTLWITIAIKISENLPSDVKTINFNVAPSDRNKVSYRESTTYVAETDKANTDNLVVQNNTVILTADYVTNVEITANKSVVALGEAVEITVSFASNRPSDYIWNVISCTLAPLTNLNGFGEVDRSLLQYIQPLNATSNSIEEIDCNFGISVIDKLQNAYTPGILYSGVYTSKRMLATNVYWITIGISISEDLPADISSINLGMRSTDYNKAAFRDKVTNAAETDVGGTGSFIAQGCTLIISR